MKKERIAEIINRARQAGSSASTLKGAGRFLIKNAGPIWEKRKPYFFDRQVRREEWVEKDHAARLCRRYVGLSRLPRFISPRDRAIIRAHPANKEYKKLTELPVFARAFYLNLCNYFPKLRSFCNETRKNKGNLVESDKIAWHAYEVADWGRMRKRNIGDVSLTPEIRTEDNGKSGWDRVVWHYADYTLIAPHKKGRKNNYKMFYIDPNKERRIVYKTPNFIKVQGEESIRLKKEKSPVDFPVHIQRQILAAVTPAILNIGYDRENKTLTVTDSTGEIFHLSKIKNHAQARVEIIKAVAAFRRRRAEHITIDNPKKIFVSLEDSVSAGNCRTISEKVAREIAQIIGAAGKFAVRADILLAHRNDNYSRRAVSFAAARI